MTKVTPRKTSLKALLSTTMVLLLFLLCSVVSAQAQMPRQNYDRVGPTNRDNIPPDYNMGNQDLQTADTTKKEPKKRKPLESFYFADSLKQRSIFAWKVSMLNNDVTLTEVDTLLQDFHTDYKFMREDVGSIYLGNLGSASMPINYFRRQTPEDFAFLNVWQPYIMRPEKAMFYNSKTPYSRISYHMSGGVANEESMFEALISHNISPSTSFNLVYDAQGTKGQYRRQYTLARHFAANFAHTGKKYALHAGYIYNHGIIYENGGISDDREVTDTILPNPNLLAVNLQTAQNEYRGNTFWLTQSLGIPLRKLRENEETIEQAPTIYAGMSMEYSKFGRRYSDRGETTFFEHNYIDKNRSYDSVGQSYFDAKFFAQLQPYDRNGIVGLVTGGIGNKSRTYYTATDTLPDPYYISWRKADKSTTYLYGTAEGAFRKYLKWDALLQYNLFGYRSNDLTLKGNMAVSAYINKKPVTLSASVEQRLTEPDYWALNYFSNHYGWTNSFEKESTTTLDARLTIPSMGFEAGITNQLASNKMYFNSDALPAQYDQILNVTGFYLQKNFRLGKFRLNNRVLMQWSSNQEVAPVPAASAFLSYLYEFDVVKNVLRLQIGLDGRYNTMYYTPGYNPALAQFYNQREKELGDYPYVDLFVSGKWKRLRILVKFQHLNTHMGGERNYFLALHQPANRRMFKIGLSWSFYD